LINVLRLKFSKMMDSSMIYVDLWKFKGVSPVISVHKINISA